MHDKTVRLHSDKAIKKSKCFRKVRKTRPKVENYKAFSNKKCGVKRTKQRLKALQIIQTFFCDF